MTVEIHAHDVAVFANGRKVLSVTKPGVMKVAGKVGPATSVMRANRPHVPAYRYLAPPDTPDADYDDGRPGDEDQEPAW